MKIAVSVAGNTLDAQVDRRFGRCPYFDRRLRNYDG